MKRLLVIAQDRALTRFIAEAMLERPVNAPSVAGDTWEVARAHSALEALALVEHGGRPFDCLVLDPGLEDQEVIDTVAKLRELSESKEVPIFVLSERGRGQHSRRIATERYGVAGFLEKPVTAESLRRAFEGLESRRKILLVESKIDLGERYEDALRSAGYAVERVTTGRAALDRLPRLHPDLVVAALILEDVGGTDVCVEIKRLSANSAVPVVLYGQVSALHNQEIDENAHRADDFVQAPFDEEILVERVAMLIGRGLGQKPRRRRKSLAGAPVAKTDPGVIERNTMEGPRPGDEDPPPMTAPPPSASPAPSGPARRSTRRVPCNMTMQVENQGRIYTSKTLDISHGGIFLSTTQPLEIGTRIAMTFQIPNTDHEVSAVGKVAWIGGGGSDGSHAGVGVKFSRIDPKDLKLIVDYVNRVSRVVYSAT